ncbi:MAG: hypothetical protein ACK5HO_09075 [Pseudomonadota bacterium]|jgi:hypothetical protein
MISNKAQLASGTINAQLMTCDDSLLSVYTSLSKVSASTKDKPRQKTAPPKTINELLSSVNDSLNGLQKYLKTNETGKAKSLNREQLDLVLAPLRSAYENIDSAFQNFKTTLTRLGADAFISDEIHNELIGSLEKVIEHVNSFEGLANNEKKPAAPKKSIKALKQALEELKGHSAIAVSKPPAEMPEYPLEQLLVGMVSHELNIEGVGQSAATINVVAPDFNYAAAYREAVKSGLNRAFADLVATSATNPLDLELSRKSLHGKSLLQHIETEHTTELERLSHEIERSINKRSDIHNATIRKAALREEFSKLDQQAGQLRQQLYISEQHESEEVLANSPTTDQNLIQPQPLSRIVKFVTDLFSLDKAAPGDIPPTNGPFDEFMNCESFQIGQELNDLTEQMEKLARAISELNIPQVDLQPDLNEANHALREALRSFCSGLTFHAPLNREDNLTKALLDISIPQTDKPIPLLSTLLQRLIDLGGSQEEGSVSLKDPVTGHSIKIGSNNEHNLNASLELRNDRGEVISQGPIWNHHLEEVIEHFLKHGSAELEQHEVKTWKVANQEPSVETETNLEHAKFPARAKRIVEYVEGSLLRAGLAVDRGPYQNKIDVTVGSQETITAILNPKTHEWSLAGAAEAAGIATKETISTIIDFVKAKHARDVSVLVEDRKNGPEREDDISLEDLKDKLKLAWALKDPEANYDRNNPWTYTLPDGSKITAVYLTNHKNWFTHREINGQRREPRSCRDESAVLVSLIRKLERWFDQSDGNGYQPK